MTVSMGHNPTRDGVATWPAWRIRTMAIVASVVANLVILVVGRGVTSEFPVATVGSDSQAIEFVQVIGVTWLVGLVAWGLLALLERTTPRAKAIWTTIAIAVLVLSLLGPLGSGVDTSSKVVLTCMHLATGATIIPLMRRSAVSRG